MGAMVGMAVADSVGAFLEFLPVGKKGSRFNPDTLQVEGSFNKFKLKPGQWTDDTSMGLCLADSLLVCRGYDGADIRVRFWNWWHRGYNNAFRRDSERKGSVGLGGNVAVSLKDVMDSSPSPRFESSRQDAGNGSIMRLAPVPIFFSSDPEKAAEFSEESSRTTHPGPIAAAACHFLGFFLARAINRESAGTTQTASAFLDQTVEEYLSQEWPSAPHRKLVRLLRSAEPEGSRERCWNWRDADGPFLEETLEARGSTYNGYPVSPNYIGAYSLDGLAMAMHSFYHTTSFMEALTRCVNFLGDADSTGAICGQMAGAFYGLSAIDARLVSRLRRWDCDEVALRGALLHVLGTSLFVPPPAKPVNVALLLTISNSSVETESTKDSADAEAQSPSIPKIESFDDRFACSGIRSFAGNDFFNFIGVTAMQKIPEQLLEAFQLQAQPLKWKAEHPKDATCMVHGLHVLKGKLELTLHLRVSAVMAEWEFVQSMLNRGIHRHVEKYGCYANRDIAKLVTEAGLHIALDERAHFGTTYTLVCTKTPLAKACDVALQSFQQEVGSPVVTLRPFIAPGLVLHTSASDFPMWKQTVRWEERVNRAVHIADLVDREVLPPTGAVSILENFVAYDPDDFRFRLARGGMGDRRTSSSRLQSRLSGEGSQIFREGSTGAVGGMQTTASMSDLLAPTIRERKPSKVSLDCLGGYRRDSTSNLGETVDGGYAGAPECVAEPWVPSPQASSTGAGGENIMVREESCSNLFNDFVESDETIPDKSDFEDKYALVGNGPLGEGTFGLVWRCTLKSGSGPHKEMAAKIVRKARLQPRDMKYLLGDDGEVKLHLTMKHAHICELLEYFDEPSTVTLILEYCRGGDLFDAIVAQSKTTGRGFTEKQAVHATRHVLSALQYLHKQRVVHRDIKCENILLKHMELPVEENIFKLCDFGFAAHDKGDGLSDRLGSPDTVAPEIVVGTRYSMPVDMWSAGVLIYMMLSAAPPFYATTDSEVLRKVRTGSYNLSGEPWDSLPAPPKNLIVSLMTVDPKLRPTADQ
ncbi:CPK2, partial [Symbiodinium pilosum]